MFKHQNSQLSVANTCLLCYYSMTKAHSEETELILHMKLSCYLTQVKIQQRNCRTQSWIRYLETALRVGACDLQSTGDGQLKQKQNKSMVGPESRVKLELKGQENQLKPPKSRTLYLYITSYFFLHRIPPSNYR